MLAEGKRHKEIAKTLNLSYTSIRRELYLLMAYLRADNPTAAVARAKDMNLI